MSDTRDHLREAEERQIEIYRRMEPGERLRIAMRMNQQMRELMDAGLQMEHPDWTAEQRRREISQRILYARTG